MLRIGLISYDFYPFLGGQGVEAYNLFLRLQQEDDVDVTVFSSRDNRLHDHLRIPATGYPGAGPFHFSGRFNLQLKRLISRFGLELLQIYGGPGGVMLLRDAGVPAVYVANHTYVQQFRYLGRSVYRPLARLEGIGYRRAAAIAAISTSTRDSLIEDYAIPEERITVIPVGIDTEIFKPLSVPREENSVLFVGRLCERKGVGYLIEAAREIRKEIPDFKLHIVGEGEKRESLEGKVREYALDGNVIFHGRAADEDLPLWYNRASLFCLPSLFEGFGIVCLEAMACGTPVVASNAPGITDVMPPENRDLLVEPGDVEGLSKRILELLADESRRERLGKTMRKRAETEFDWKIIAMRFLSLYKEIVHV